MQLQQVLAQIRMQKQAKSIVLSKDNYVNWPHWKELVDKGKVVVDAEGRLRYSHGAPVGELIPSGKGSYLESSEEWFDPDSPAAKSFKWPKMKTKESKLSQLFKSLLQEK